MKNFKVMMMTLMMCLMTMVSFGQTVNDIPIKDIESEYVQIVGTTNLMQTKITIRIDFGQHALKNDNRILDATGKKMVFNSMIDAINFMSSNGYEFVTAYTLTIGNSNVYHYLLRKSL